MVPVARHSAAESEVSAGMSSTRFSLTVSLTKTCVIGNSAQGGGGTFGVGQGGGIADLQGQAFLTGVSLAGNRASGALSADGGTGSLGAGGALLVGISLGTGSTGFFPGGAHVVFSGGSITGNAARGARESSQATAKGAASTWLVGVPSR